MSRLDDLPENVLVTRLLAVRRAFDELKTSKQLISSRNAVTYRIFSGLPYDIRALDVTSNNTTIEITFTPDDLSTPGLGGVFDMEWDFTYTGFGAVIRPERLVPENGISKWRLYLQGSDLLSTPTMDFKFYFFANGSGTFTATLV